MSINKVLLLGNIGNKDELREFENGGCLIQASLATNEKGYKTKDGKEVPDQTEWHSLVFYNNHARTFNQYVKKGDKIFIEGKLRTRSWEDKDRAKHYITEIVVQRMELLMPPNKDKTPPPPAPEECYNPEQAGDLPF